MDNPNPTDPAGQPQPTDETVKLPPAQPAPAEAAPAQPAPAAQPASAEAAPAQPAPAEAAPAAAAEPAAVSSGSLRGIGEYFKLALEDFKKRAVTYIVLMLAVGVLAVVGSLIGVILTPILGAIFPPLAAVGLLLAFVLYIVGMTWPAAALFLAVTDKSLDFKAAFIKAKPMLAPFLVLFALLYMMILGGMMLFVLPALLFGAWFFAAPYILICEGVMGMDALMKSREYVRGELKQVFVLLFLSWLIMAAFNLIPIVGVLLTPIGLIMWHLIYRDLRAKKADMEYKPDKNAKMTVLAVGALGLLLPVIGTAVMGAKVISMMKPGAAPVVQAPVKPAPKKPAPPKKEPAKPADAKKPADKKTDGKKMDEATAKKVYEEPAAQEEQPHTTYKQLKRACNAELGLFCNGEKTHWARYQCLKRNQPKLLDRCAEALGDFRWK